MLPWISYKIINVILDNIIMLRFGKKIVANEKIHDEKIHDAIKKQ